ncbi:MAG: hypothetical protein IJB73_00425 [Firmicutes bacterium]|nr:hypothetical protein [Bacillota bacterium]
MEKVTKTIGILDKVKWLGLLFGVFMCLFIEPRLGEIWAMGLGTVAGVAFIYICNNEKKTVLSEHVAMDLKEALQTGGYKDSVIEIKHLRAGMLIRIYVVRAGDNAVYCNGIVVQQIERSWYKEKVWITQLVDIDDADAVKTARDTLDEELISDLKKMRDDARGRKK